MPNFTTVIYDKAITKALTERLEEKEVLLELKVVLQKALTLAERNHKMWKSMVGEYKTSAKTLMNEAEEAFESIKRGDGDSDAMLKIIETNRQKVASSSEQADREAEEYAAAFRGDGFRATLRTGVILRLNEFKKVPAYKDCKVTTPLGKQIFKYCEDTESERATIITEDTVILAERQRLNEYVDRLETLHSTAQKLASGEKLEKSKFLEGANAIKAAIGTDGNEDTLLGMYAQFERKLESVQSLLDFKGTTLAAAQMRLKTMLTEGEKSRKFLSGKLKTALLELQALKSVYGKKLFAKLALSSLEKTLVKLTNDVKTQEARYNNKLKLLREAIEKLST